MQRRQTLRRSYADTRCNGMQQRAWGRRSRLAAASRSSIGLSLSTCPPSELTSLAVDRSGRVSNTAFARCKGIPPAPANVGFMRTAHDAASPSAPVSAGCFHWPNSRERYFFRLVSLWNRVGSTSTLFFAVEWKCSRGVPPLSLRVQVSGRPARPE